MRAELERGIEEDLATIANLFILLGKPELREDDPQETLVVVGFRLHTLFNGFATLFRRIAETFEGAPEDDEWNAALLRQMRLDLSPLRPAVIDDEAFEVLDELRRCRQAYLTVYAAELDRQRVGLAVRKALVLQAIYARQLRSFLRSLR